MLLSRDMSNTYFVFSTYVIAYTKGTEMIKF